jgi:hypothetical protein
MRDRSFFVPCPRWLHSKAHSFGEIQKRESIVDFPRRFGYMLTC